MIDYRNIIKNRELRLKIINLLRFIPTKPYLKMVYWIKTGQKLNLKNPVTFDEKLQWLKIHDLHPEYTQLVDKYEVREIVSDKIGKKHLFPLLGVWNKFEEIDFDKLPEQFVLKCTHDSGSVKIITNKNEADLKELKRFFQGRLKLNPYYQGREYPYKNVLPRIIAEKYMEDKAAGELIDYKFYCFNGNAEILLVATNRQNKNEELCIDYFDSDYNHLELLDCEHPNAKVVPKKPKQFELMKKIANELSVGIPFVRIDLYEVNGDLYFGEYTFYESGGYIRLYPKHWEKKLGDLIILPK